MSHYPTHSEPRLLEHVRQPDQIRSAISRRFGEIAILKERLAKFELGQCGRCALHQADLDDCIGCGLINLCPHCMTAHTCRLVLK